MPSLIRDTGLCHRNLPDCVYSERLVTPENKTCGFPLTLNVCVGLVGINVVSPAILARRNGFARMLSLILNSPVEYWKRKDSATRRAVLLHAKWAHTVNGDSAVRSVVVGTKNEFAQLPRRLRETAQYAQSYLRNATVIRSLAQCQLRAV